MTSTIKIKNSSTAGAVPGSGDLVQGELAVNVTDKKIYTKNASGTVVNLGTTPSITDNGNATAITIDSSENVGLGVSPSSWGTSSTYFKALDIGQQASIAGLASGQQLSVSLNAYYNAGWKFASTATASASQYYQSAGQHIWQTAGSPASHTTGDAISFTQAMTLDASGHLNIGATSGSSDTPLLVQESANGNRYIVISNPNTGNAAAGALQVAGSGGDLRLLGYSSSHATQAYNASIFNHSGAGSLLFGTNATERARIDSSGNFKVGTSSSEQVIMGPSETSFTTGTNGAVPIRIYNNYTSGTRYCIEFRGTGGPVGAITHNGTSTTYSTSSDYRLKNSVTPMTGALARVCALKPVTYKWNSDGSEGDGFIAHELQEVCPNAVTGEKDAVNEDGSIKPQSIDTSFLVATLTAAIQELKAEFDAYKATHP